MLTSPRTPPGTAPPFTRATSNPAALTDMPLFSHAIGILYSPGALYFETTNSAPRLAVVASSTVWVRAPTRAVFKGPTCTSRDVLTKRLCTGDYLLHTSLEVLDIGSRALPYRTDVVAGHSFYGSIPKAACARLHVSLSFVAWWPLFYEHSCHGQSLVRRCTYLSLGYGAWRVESTRVVLVSP